MSTITVAVLTYKRPDQLIECLQSLQTYALNAIDELLVIDNDPAGSAKRILSEWENSSLLPKYVNETIPGVANARNRAIAEASGEILVFIDDDEKATRGWPEGLIQLMKSTGAALVGGPVKPEFNSPAPELFKKFFHRPAVAENASLNWLRSGNLAIDLEQIKKHDISFDPNRAMGEDVLFSRQAKSAGLDIRWTNTASVIEVITKERLSRPWRLTRERDAAAAWASAELELYRPTKAKILAIMRALANFTLGVAFIGLSRLGFQKPDTDKATQQLLTGEIYLAKAKGHLQIITIKTDNL